MGRDWRAAARQRVADDVVVFATLDDAVHAVSMMRYLPQRSLRSPSPDQDRLAHLGKPWRKT